MIDLFFVVRWVRQNVWHDANTGSTRPGRFLPVDPDGVLKKRDNTTVSGVVRAGRLLVGDVVPARETKRCLVCAGCRMSGGGNARRIGCGPRTPMRLLSCASEDRTRNLAAVVRGANTP